jgi:hypothetical protein
VAALPELTRRIFLSRSLQAVGLLAVGPACAPSGRTEAPAGLAALSPGSWEILAAAADTFVPRGGAFELGARDVDLATRIDAFLAQGDPDLVPGLEGGLVFLEWAGPILAGRLGRFSHLGPEDRTAVVAALPRRGGPGRALYAGLKQICLFAFYTVPETWGPAGYDGPWV